MASRFILPIRTISILPGLLQAASQDSPTSEEPHCTALITAANLLLPSPIPDSRNKVPPAPLISYHMVLIPKQSP